MKNDIPLNSRVSYFFKFFFGSWLPKLLKLSFYPNIVSICCPFSALPLSICGHLFARDQAIVSLTSLSSEMAMWFFSIKCDSLQPLFLISLLVCHWWTNEKSKSTTREWPSHREEKSESSLLSYGERCFIVQDRKTCCQWKS